MCLHRKHKVDHDLHLQITLPGQYEMSNGWYDNFACVMNKKHPLASHYDLETYLKAQHIWVSKTGFGVGVGIDPNEVQKLGWVYLLG